MLPQFEVMMVMSFLRVCRLPSLRLEAQQVRDYRYSRSDLTRGYSSLLSLQQLYFTRLKVLGSQPAQVAAALRPLRRLQALVGDERSPYWHSELSP